MVKYSFTAELRPVQARRATVHVDGRTAKVDVYGYRSLDVDLDSLEEVDGEDKEDWLSRVVLAAIEQKSDDVFEGVDVLDLEEVEHDVCAVLRHWRGIIEERDRAKCALCVSTVANLDAAQDEGWEPFYWSAGKRFEQPVCPACTREHLHDPDNTGDMKLRA